LVKSSREASATKSFAAAGPMPTTCTFNSDKPSFENISVAAKIGLLRKEGKPLNPQMTQTQTQWNERACVFSTPPEISNTISNILVKS